jgi:hypothetical protein
MSTSARHSERIYGPQEAVPLPTTTTAAQLELGAVEASMRFDRS